MGSNMTILFLWNELCICWVSLVLTLTNQCTLTGKVNKTHSTYLNIMAPVKWWDT